MGRRLRCRQRGAALLIMLIVLAIGLLTYLVGELSPELIRARQARATAEALAQARDALLGYAQKYRDEETSQGRPDRMYGYLPLPDLGSTRNNNVTCVQEGCDANTPTDIHCDARNIYPTLVGRLPWRTLGIEPLRDGNGECLWLMVSSLHLRKHCSPANPPPMNWDTLGQLDIAVANGAHALAGVLENAHDRPVAVIFSPGPPLAGQNRAIDGASGNDVTMCGGNYNAMNYLDPVRTESLGGLANYLGDKNAASGVTGDSDPANDPDPAKPLLVGGAVWAKSGATSAEPCRDSACTILANDVGARITPDQLFDALRNNANFRGDINTLLDNMVGCLRDSGAINKGKIDTSACYDDTVHPRGYFTHYREMILTAPNAKIKGADCAGALLFGGQRNATQRRVTVADKGKPDNYLEAPNLAEYLAGTHRFDGPASFDRVSRDQSASQDIVRCIPAEPRFKQVASPALDPLGGQLTQYDTTKRTLTLGRLFSISSSKRNNNIGALFGCSWMPEAHAFGGGLRTYFRFRIEDTGEGFTFAIVDGDRNSTQVCGAARQHLGYSGNNGVTASIAPPKIGIEFDTSYDMQTTPYGDAYGRSDPTYAGHAGIVYWGTGTTADDDNVHGLPPEFDASSRPVPRNPPVPAVPTQNGAAIARLDSTSIGSLIGKNIHVRVEVVRLATDAEQHARTLRIEVWVVKGDTATAVVSAMRNTTRPMTQLYPGIDTAAYLHLRDQPTFYDVQGGECIRQPCPSGQVCGKDGLCYAEDLRTVRLGFTTAQSTAAKDQIITLHDFATTWIP